MKTVDGIKDQIMSLFKTKDYVKTVYGGGKKHSEESMIKGIRSLLKLKKKMKQLKIE